jgi:hypothetical protein
MLVGELPRLRVLALGQFSLSQVGNPVSPSQVVIGVAWATALLRGWSLREQSPVRPIAILAIFTFPGWDRGHRAFSQVGAYGSSRSVPLQHAIRLA